MFMILILENWLLSTVIFSTKVTCAFLLQENMQEWSESNYLPKFWSANGTIVNRALASLNKVSLETTLIVPIMRYQQSFLHFRIQIIYFRKKTNLWYIWDRKPVPMKLVKCWFKCWNPVTHFSQSFSGQVTPTLK